MLKKWYNMLKNLLVRRKYEILYEYKIKKEITK